MHRDLGLRIAQKGAGPPMHIERAHAFPKAAHPHAALGVWHLQRSRQRLIHIVRAVRVGEHSPIQLRRRARKLGEHEHAVDPGAGEA